MSLLIIFVMFFAASCVTSEVPSLNLLLACLESAYSLILGAQRIWGHDLNTFIISRPIKQGTDW